MLCKVLINDKISYKLLNDQVIISDEVVSSVNTSTNINTQAADIDSTDGFAQDFLDFKRYVLHEITNLKDEKENINTNEKDRDEYTLIQSLKDRIQSLEKQLDGKQKIIEMLLTREISEPKCEEINSYKKFPVKTTPNCMTSTFENQKCKNQTPTNLNTPKGKRSKALIIGDSMLNGINEKGIKSDYDVKIRAYAGASSEDLFDFIKPEIRKHPERIVIHAGTNDLQHNIKTVDNIKKILDYAKSNSPDTEFSVSAITIRKDDVDLERKVCEMNGRLKKFAERNNVIFLDHANIDESCLSHGKLHLNKKGKSLMANNFMKSFN